MYGEDTYIAVDGGVGEEFVLTLGADCRDKPKSN